MHFVAALDDVPAMRGVLCLFEGVVTGAADGYGRVAGRPAATLLHLGPGLGNGLANLHNARRARTPIVNIVGDHATYHARYDAPLQSDIASIAGAVSGWYRSTARADDVAADAADAVAAALGPAGLRGHAGPPGGRLVVGVGHGPCPPRPADGRAWCRPTRSRRWPRPCGEASAPHSSSADGALRAEGLDAASRVGDAGGRRSAGRDLPGQSRAGSGRPGGGPAGLPRRDGAGPTRRRAASGAGRRQGAGVLLRLPRQGQRSGPRAAPSTRWRGPGRTPQAPWRRSPRPWALPWAAASRRRRAARAAFWRPHHRDAGGGRGRRSARGRHRRRRGQHLGPLRAGGDGGGAPSRLADAHGGAIGIGLPMATGAAVAAPERPVLCLQADGSAMYTLQALWTQAREDSTSPRSSSPIGATQS